MQQLSIFDTERPVGFLNRWHLYRDDTLMYTAIPSQEGVRLVGLPQPMKNAKEVLNLTQSEYNAHKRKYKLEEVHNVQNKMQSGRFLYQPHRQSGGDDQQATSTQCRENRCVIKSE